MQLTTVESSMIHAIGYDAEQQLLEIVFNTGRTYQYLEVPPEVYKELMKAESKGRYFLANVRDMYPYQPAGRSRGRR
jgi:hypothetical protein